jgi:hypothetical protein
MTAHKFKIGQLVTLGSKRLSDRGGAFTVVRQLPKEDGDFQYRIKSIVDGHERMVLEAELS